MKVKHINNGRIQSKKKMKHILGIGVTPPTYFVQGGGGGWGGQPQDLYSKRINSANGISRSFFSSHKCFFKMFKNAFKPNASNWE